MKLDLYKDRIKLNLTREETVDLIQKLVRSLPGEEHGRAIHVDTFPCEVVDENGLSDDERRMIINIF